MIAAQSIERVSLNISNMHCPSCVSKIQSLMSDPVYNGRWSKIHVSLLNQTVTIDIEKLPTVKDREHLFDDAARLLTDEGFEVDLSDQIYRTSTKTMRALWNGGWALKLVKGKERQTPEEAKRRLHLQNCTACREGRLDVEKRNEHDSLQDFQSSMNVADPRSPGHVTEREATTMQTTLSIEGMTCSSCSNSIERSLGKMTGVQHVNIDLLGNRGVVTHSNEIDASTIRTRIDDLGYDTLIVNSGAIGSNQAKMNERTVRIQIQGIYCGFCVEKINSHLRSLNIAFTPIDGKNHTTEIRYIPHSPHTIRSILSGLSNVSPELYACLFREPNSIDRSKEIQNKHFRILLVHWMIAFIFTVPTFVIGIVGMVLLPSSNRFHQLLMRPIWGAANLGTIIIWPIATVVQFGVGRLFYAGAFGSFGRFFKSKPQSVNHRLTWKSFFSFGSMDLLVALSTSVSYFASLAMVVIDVNSSEMSSVGSYFDSCVFLIMFILLGRLLEAFAKSRTTSAVLLLGKLRPESALLVEQPRAFGFQNSHEKLDEPDKQIFGPSMLVPVEHIEQGDLIHIPPGSLPPTDGVVVAGETDFDESSLTGESRSIHKSVGDEVYTGTTNLTGLVTIRVTSSIGDTMLERIMQAVSEASCHKSPIEKLAESLTGIFVPIIIYLAAIVLLVWLSLAGAGILANAHEGKGGGVYFFAIEFAIATLVVACPCGIGLAAPCANVVGTGLVAKAGGLAATGGEAFLSTSKVGVVVMDKTGTLTTGSASVTNEKYWNVGPVDQSTVDALVFALGSDSSHPLSRALVSYVGLRLAQGRQRALHLTSREIAGQGVKGCLDLMGERWEVLIGNHKLMENHHVEIKEEIKTFVTQWSHESKSSVLVALKLAELPGSQEPNRFSLAAAFALHDPPRPEAAAVIKNLHNRGLKVIMLSGDNLSTATAVGREVGIAPEDVFAGVGPEDKAAVIRRIQGTLQEARIAKGSVWRYLMKMPLVRKVLPKQVPLPVMFVGDGINDSVALAQADVSVAMGHGSQATLAGSDFILLSSSLEPLPKLFTLSRRIVRRQKINLTWACLFNIVCIPFAAGVFYAAGGIRLTPVWSAVVMACSSISVVCSSLALRIGV